MADATAPAIELSGISKSFGPVQANKDISMTVAKGTIHGIVGENGAGKSTLMSILYGFYQADRGEIRVDGELTEIKSPDDAIAAGIGMVHQHFMLVDNFTVLENLVLGAENRFWVKETYAAACGVLQQIEQDYAQFTRARLVRLHIPVQQHCRHYQPVQGQQQGRQQRHAHLAGVAVLDR